MKNVCNALLALAFMGSSLWAQTNVPTQRTCGTPELVTKLLANPAYKAERDAIENFTANYIANNPKSTNAVITIPVVVHVVYNTTAENISDAQINSQMGVLNKDYRRTNADANQTPSGFQGIAADCEIEFCLATVDPSGNPTTGITRTQTSVQSFDIGADDVKFTNQGGINAWPRNKYLNIWVCDLGGGLLGYATPPGGPASTDGVVIGYRYFGTTGTATSPYNKGRTATHEIGHWLNLEHIWGDDGGSCGGSDNVADTPNQGQENYGCPSFPETDNCTPNSPGVMFMNYMDYTDDGCMNLFTTGQKNRMIAALNGPRASILTSDVCGGGNPNPTAECDTLLNAPASAEAIVYAAPGNNAWGFLAGTNSYADKAKADKFVAMPQNFLLEGAFYLIAVSYGTNNSKSFTATAWNANGNGEPNTAVAQKSVTYNSVTEGQYNYVDFDSPVAINGAYFVGIEFNPTQGDTIALATTTVGDVTANTAWEKWEDNSWNDYESAYGEPFANYIAPVICPLVSVSEQTKWDGVSVFPNPAGQSLNVYLKMATPEAVTLKLLNPMGQVVLTQSHSPSAEGTYTLNTANLASGLYFVEVTGGNMTRGFKVVINN